MSSQNRGKLNWLQHNLPEGLYVDAGWLEHHGFSRQLRRKYVENHWLSTVARGVFRKSYGAASNLDASDTVHWLRVVVSLQILHRFPVVVGGHTALGLQGFEHYLPAGEPHEVHLYGTRTLPGWVRRLPLNTKIVFHSAAKLFVHNEIPTDWDITERKEASADPAGFARHALNDHTRIVLSAPERAILELLDEVPQRETFHQADVLMEGMRNLSPRRLQMLLMDCRSIKVKRLFLWFAKRHNPAWLSKLDLTGVNLGRGKRMIVRGGKLDSELNITVPEKLDAGI